jgi:hypothetical protein
MKIGIEEVLKAARDVVKSKDAVFKDKEAKNTLILYCIKKLKLALEFYEGKNERKK